MNSSIVQDGLGYALVTTLLLKLQSLEKQTKKVCLRFIGVVLTKDIG